LGTVFVCWSFGVDRLGERIVRLNSISAHLAALSPKVTEMSGLANQFRYRPLVPVVEVQFQHVDAINLKTGDAIYGTVNATQFLTMGFNVVYLKMGQQTLSFFLTITPQGLDFRNRDLVDIDDPTSNWTIRDIRARVTYESQSWNHRQKPLYDPVIGGHPRYEVAAGWRK
ncbi:TPA: hypothetical protein ACQVY6_005261, partial [Serratia marcescens]